MGGSARSADGVPSLGGFAAFVGLHVQRGLLLQHRVDLKLHDYHRLEFRGLVPEED